MLISTSSHGRKSITCYYRYVDDSFIVIIKNKLLVLLSYLNNYRDRLNFTCKKEGEKQEKKNQILFLDVLVKIEFDGSLKLDLYKNPTFSGRYINYLSSHSIAMKKGLVENLTQKIFNLSNA